MKSIIIHWWISFIYLLFIIILNPSRRDTNRTTRLNFSQSQGQNLLASLESKNHTWHARLFENRWGAFEDEDACEARLSFFINILFCLHTDTSTMQGVKINSALVIASLEEEWKSRKACSSLNWKKNTYLKMYILKREEKKSNWG